VTVLYVSFWLSLSILLSVVFRQASTSALAGIAIWLFLTLFGSVVARLVADALVPLPANPSVEQVLRHDTLELWLARLSPSFLYSEATFTLMTPQLRALGPILLTELEGALLEGALPLSQSLLLIWPHLVGLIGATLVLFSISYVLFMRREVRA
jgi:ABC-2 type transport system permease protein